MARDRLELTLGEIRHLEVPCDHDIRAEHIDFNRLGGVLAVAYERDLHNFADFLFTEKLGPRTCKRCPWSPKSSTARRCVSTIPRATLRAWREGRTPVSCPAETYDRSIDVAIAGRGKGR